MTTPFEEKEALKNINQFLMDLCYIRARHDRIELANKLLRHYPSNSEIERFWIKNEIPL